MKGKIYKIYNDVNDKLYIGKTLDTIENRLKEHKKDSKRVRKEKRPLYNAMNKYGTEHFYIELIEEVDLELLSQRECYWIEFYNTYYNGYNATKGGDGRQLYDYDLIVEVYLQGLTMKEISNQLGCDVKVIRNALKLVNIDTFQNMVKSFGKSVAAYDKEHNLIASFDSESDAARWLINEGIAQTDSVKTVGSVVARAAKGQRKSAYKMLWEFI